MREIQFIEILPEPLPRRDVAKYAHAAKNDPEGRWVLLPYLTRDDPHGCVVGNLRRQHKLEARTVNGRIYCRRPPTSV